jgi:hypothetical protein
VDVPEKQEADMSKKLQQLIWGNPELTRKGKKIYAGEEEFKTIASTKPGSLIENVALLRIPEAYSHFTGFDKPNLIMIWLLDSPEEVLKVKKGKRQLAFFNPPRVSFTEATIDSIFEKGDQSKNIVGGVLASVQGDHLEVLMMATRNGYKRNAVNTFLVNRLKEITKAVDVSFHEVTDDGREFEKAYNRVDEAPKPIILKGISRDSFLKDEVYSYYVIDLDSGEILSAWEYREDAKDSVEDFSRKRAKVFFKRDVSLEKRKKFHEENDLLPNRARNPQKRMQIGEAIPAKEIRAAVSKACKEVVKRGFNKPEFRVDADKEPDLLFEGILPDGIDRYGYCWTGNRAPYDDPSLNSQVYPGTTVTLQFTYSDPEASAFERDTVTAGDITLNTVDMSVEIRYDRHE